MTLDDNVHEAHTWFLDLAKKISPKTARLRIQLQKIEALPPSDQRALLKFLDALLESRGMTPTSGRSLNQSNP